MSINNFIFSRKLCLPLAVAALAFVSTSEKSQGGVLVTFDDSGPTITTVLSGSIDTSGLLSLSAGFGSVSNTVVHTAGLASLVTLAQTTYNPDATNLHDILYDFSGRVQNTTQFTVSVPSTGLVKSFGFDSLAGALYVPIPLVGNILVLDSSFGSWGWNEETLADIGLGSLTTTAVTVFENTNVVGTDGIIQFVRAASGSAPVPEPSVLLLNLTGLLLLRRRRK